MALCISLVITIVFTAVSLILSGSLKSECMCVHHCIHVCVHSCMRVCVCVCTCLCLCVYAGVCRHKYSCWKTVCLNTGYKFVHEERYAIFCMGVVWCLPGYLQQNYSLLTFMPLFWVWKRLRSWKCCNWTDSRGIASFRYNSYQSIQPTNQTMFYFMSVHSKVILDPPQKKNQYIQPASLRIVFLCKGVMLLYFWSPSPCSIAFLCREWKIKSWSTSCVVLSLFVPGKYNQLCSVHRCPVWEIVLPVWHHCKCFY